MKQLTAINKFLTLASVILFSTHLSQALIVGESVTVQTAVVPTLVGLSEEDKSSSKKVTYALHPISNDHALALVPKKAEITEARHTLSASGESVKLFAVVEETDEYQLVLYYFVTSQNKQCFSLLNEEEEIESLDQDVSIITIGDSASLPQESDRPQKLVSLRNAIVCTKNNRTCLKVPFESNNVLLEPTDVGAALVKKDDKRNILLGLALGNNREGAGSSFDEHNSYFLSLTPKIREKIKKFAVSPLLWSSVTSGRSRLSLSNTGTSGSSSLSDGQKTGTGTSSGGSATNSLKPQTIPQATTTAPKVYSAPLPSWEKCSYAQLREYLGFSDESNVFYGATNQDPREIHYVGNRKCLVYPHGVIREKTSDGGVRIEYPEGLRLVKGSDSIGYTASIVSPLSSNIDSLKYIYPGRVIEFFDSINKLVWIFRPGGGKLSINWENGLAKSYSDSGELKKMAYLFGDNRVPRGYLVGENELWGLKLVVPQENRKQSQVENILSKEQTGSSCTQAGNTSDIEEVKITFPCDLTLGDPTITYPHGVVELLRKDKSTKITYPTGIQLTKEKGKKYYTCSEILPASTEDISKEYARRNGVRESYNCAYGWIQFIYPNEERLIVDCKKGIATLFGKDWAPIARGSLFGNEEPRVYLSGEFSTGLGLIFEPSEVSAIQENEKEEDMSQQVGLRANEEGWLGHHKFIGDTKDALIVSDGVPGPMNVFDAFGSGTGKTKTKEKELETCPREEKDEKQPMDDSLQMNIKEFFKECKEKMVKGITAVELENLANEFFTRPNLDGFSGEIEKISLKGNVEATDATLKCLAAFTNLRELSLSTKTSITGAGLSYLPRSLTYLYLGNCAHLLDEHVKSLAHLTELKDLYLPNCDHITDTGLSYLPESITTLQIVAESGMSDEVLKGLEHLTNLEKLGLFGDTKLTGAGFSYLPTNLTHLNIGRGRDMVDEDIISLAHRCPHLTWLDLPMSSKITDKGIIELVRNCTKLKNLKLYQGSSITDKSITEIVKHCRELETIFLLGCDKITDGGLLSLSTLPKLDRVLFPWGEIKSGEELRKTLRFLSE